MLGYKMFRSSIISNLCNRQSALINLVKYNCYAHIIHKRRHKYNRLWLDNFSTITGPTYRYNDFHQSRCFGTEAPNQKRISDTSSELFNSEDISVNSKIKPKTKKQLKIETKLLYQELERDFEELNRQEKKIRDNSNEVFPNPMSKLNSICQSISSHLNKSVSKKTSYRRLQSPVIWECHLTVPWPEEKAATGRAKSKQEAAHRAALKILLWLQEMKLIDSKGQISLLTFSDVQLVKRRPLADVKLSDEIIPKINDLLDKYTKEVLTFVKSQEKAVFTDDANDASDNYIAEEDILKYDNVNPKSEQWINKRNLNLLHKHSRKLDNNMLPISGYREDFLKLLKDNRVVVVTGDTGCGKSTQIPQFIFDDYASRMQGTSCRIVVTQPRRISAISLAQYIAHERKEKVGDIAGYQVRLKSVLPHPQAGGIIFCTTGILLRKIISDPELSDISHIIIDEAHERDINTDFLLALIKRAIQVNPNLRVVIMSATINAELFQKYYNDAPCLHVPGLSYPVKQHFFDSQMAKILRIDNVNEFCQSAKPRVDGKVVARMVQWIDRNKPAGAILVFLPGWAEIQQALKYLENEDQLFVVPVHSKLNYRQQQRIFENPACGLRKVILATNIAETSITISDVVYVVDTGAHKEERLDMKSGIACLDNHWVSTANVKQRQGRAGRVQAGESFHLYTKDKYYSFDSFPTPQIFRVPLEKSVLDCKMYSATDEEVAEFFSDLPQPPSEDAVSQAVSVLQQMSALDSNEDLTPLGKRIYLFTTHPVLSKALVHAAVFKCLNPLLTIVTLLSSDYSLFRNAMVNKETIKITKQKFSACSDHLALAQMYSEWEELYRQSSVKAEIFCQENGIFDDNMFLTQKLKQLLGDYLYKSKLLNSIEDYNNINGDCNLYAHNDELVKSVLLSGLGKILVARNFKLLKGRMKHCNDVVSQTGKSAKVGGDSVNHRRKSFPSPFLTYYRAMSSLERPVLKIWDSSIVSPISLLLFIPGIINMRNVKNVDGSTNTIFYVKGIAPINVACDNEHAKIIFNLREMIWSVVSYLVEHEGHPTNQEQYEMVAKFRDEMLSVLSDLLTQQGETTDYSNA